MSDVIIQKSAQNSARACRQVREDFFKKYRTGANNVSEHAVLFYTELDASLNMSVDGVHRRNHNGSLNVLHCGFGNFGVLCWVRVALAEGGG